MSTTRRRRIVRRLLMVSLLLGFLTVVGSWLTRPHIDQRFVGRWQGQVTGPDITHFAFTIDFDEDGEATRTLATGEQHSLLWRVEGARLELTQKRSPLGRVVRMLEHFVNGRREPRFDYALSITEVSVDSIVLDYRADEGAKSRWNLWRYDASTTDP